MLDEPPNIIKAGKHRTTNSNVYLIMEQSFHHEMRLKFDLNGCILIRDEVHKGKEGKRFNDIVNHLQPQKVIGLSATPYDERGVFCGGSNCEYIVGTTVEKLEKEGYLVPTKYYIPKIVEKLDFGQLKTSGNDYSLKDIENLFGQEVVLKYLKDFFSKFDFENRKTLIVCSTVDHAEKVANLIEGNGAVVHSKKSDEHNQKAIEMFRNGYIDYLVSVSMLTVGFDAPIADTLINLRPTKVRRLWVQLAGRIKRPYEGKEESYLYDFGNCLVNLGFPEEYYEPPKEAHSITKSNATSFLEQYIDNHQDEVVEVSKAKLELFIEEVKKLERQNLSKLTTEELVKLFRTTDDIEIMIRCANEYHFRKHGWKLRENTIQLMVSNALIYHDELSLVGKGGSTMKAYRTRLRNILNKNKKLASFIYFPEWFYNETKRKYPWLFNDIEMPF
jgi:type I site-specific restriction endonuclease